MISVRRKCVNGKQTHCHVCGKEFITDPGNRRRKTCSKECEISSKSHVGSNHPRWGGKKPCAVCGKEINGAWKRKSDTCSPECAVVYKSRLMTGSGNPRWKEGHVYCRECGIEITHKSRWFVSFCSRRCMGLWQSKNLSKENSPLWKGGSAYGVYPPEFNAKLRSSIRKSYDCECQVCRKKSRSLDVHHIDENKSNNNPENLIPVCRSCHRKVHWGTASL